MLTFFFPSPGLVYSRCYSHGELMGVAAKPKKKLALVIATAVEGEFVRLINRTDFKLLALRRKSNF